MNTDALADPVESRRVRGEETILVVDDEPAVRLVLSDLLHHAGYCVMAAAHGGEAVRLMREHTGRVDLAILDVVMPELDGPDTWNALHALRSDLRVLFVSGYVGAGYRERLPRGAPLLPKPFQMQELLARVRDLLDA